MSENTHQHPAPDRSTGFGGGFWRSGTGVALIVFLAIGVLLLGYEHRLHIFGSSSGSAIFLIVWIGLHFLMHRGHGGHARHGSHGSSSTPPAARRKESNHE